jgi:hypothetical protein
MDLRDQFAAAIRRHWRAMLDHSGPTPGLLDDLVAIATPAPAGQEASGAPQAPPPTPPPAPNPGRPARASTPRRTAGSGRTRSPAKPKESP